MNMKCIIFKILLKYFFIAVCMENFVSDRNDSATFIFLTSGVKDRMGSLKADIGVFGLKINDL